MSSDVAHQREIENRKSKAAFYTRPEAADYLAARTLDLFSDPAIPQSDRPRVADFACGTGNILEAASRWLPEAKLYGADIEPDSIKIARERLPQADLRLLPFDADSLGSLDLINESTDTLFGRAWAPHAHFDAVIMNPPYTRNTNHSVAGVQHPVFKHSGASPEAQDRMAARLKRLHGPCGDGRAGIATNFIDLAHLKLRPGGVLGLILPFTFATGSGWEAARRLLERQYVDASVIAIAGPDRALSHDTGMAEVMVIARKWTGAGVSPTAWINIDGIDSHRHVNSTLDWMDAGYLAGVKDISIIDDVRQLAGPLQTLARTDKSPGLGTIGPRDRSVGAISGRFNQGAYTVSKDPVDSGTFRRGLCHCDAKTQRSLAIKTDCDLITRHEEDVKPPKSYPTVSHWAQSLWSQASRLHISLRPQFTSQALTSAYTEEDALAACSWTSYDPHKRGAIYPLILWMNSTLGVIHRWIFGNRIQAGRSSATRLTLAKYLVPDFPPEIFDRSKQVFDRLRDVELKPMIDAAEDEGRIRIDTEFLGGCMGFSAPDMGGLHDLARCWAREPHLRGGR